MTNEYNDILKKAKSQYNITKKSLSLVAARKIRDLDRTIHQYHDEIFASINCRECANCCRKLGPLINETDIDRISSSLRLRRGDFIARYLRIDEDGDYVFKTMPCRFNGPDNLCEIYDDRPRACRDYPHTQEKNMNSHIKRLADHTIYCPAAFLIAQKIIAKYC